MFIDFEDSPIQFLDMSVGPGHTVTSILTSFSSVGEVGGGFKFRVSPLTVLFSSLTLRVLPPSVGKVGLSLFDLLDLNIS